MLKKTDFKTDMFEDLVCIFSNDKKDFEKILSYINVKKED
jgi:hypothetical protein